VKVTLLSSCVAGGAPDELQFLSTSLVNDALAIDAGCLGFCGSPQDQARVRHVFISHSHIDHVASLPVFVENVFENTGDCVAVYGSAAVLDSCQRDLFNNRLWPDFVALSGADCKFLDLVPFEPGQTIEAAGLRITAVELDHVVPTCGFIVRDDHATVAFISDTAPSDAIWRHLNAEPNLKAIFIETTFPNSLQWLADVSKHLTPATLADELAKLHRPARIIIVHIKARHRAEVLAQLHQLNRPDLEIGCFGTLYLF
jgi:ribonuclease BN (tRNA processing enzyme)